MNGKMVKITAIIIAAVFLIGLCSGISAVFFF